MFNPTANPLNITKSDEQLSRIRVNHFVTLKLWKSSSKLASNNVADRTKTSKLICNGSPMAIYGAIQRILNAERLQPLTPDNFRFSYVPIYSIKDAHQRHKQSEGSIGIYNYNISSVDFDNFSHFSLEQHSNNQHTSCNHNSTSNAISSQSTSTTSRQQSNKLDYQEKHHLLQEADKELRNELGAAKYAKLRKHNKLYILSHYNLKLADPKIPMSKVIKHIDDQWEKMDLQKKMNNDRNNNINNNGNTMDIQSLMSNLVNLMTLNALKNLQVSQPQQITPTGHPLGIINPLNIPQPASLSPSQSYLQPLYNNNAPPTLPPTKQPNGYNATHSSSHSVQDQRHSPYKKPKKENKENEIKLPDLSKKNG